MSDSPAVPDKHAIKAELARRGLTLVAVARQAGIERSGPGVALLRRHFAGEAAIAAALGTAPEALWPERYVPGAADGVRAPRPHRRPRRASAKSLSPPLSPPPSASSPSSSARKPAQPSRARRRRTSPNRSGV